MRKRELTNSAITASLLLTTAALLSSPTFASPATVYFPSADGQTRLEPHF